VLVREADCRVRRDEQRGARALGRPALARLVVGVVDPRDRAVGAGEGLDRGELPVRRRLRRLGEGEVRPAARETEQSGQMILGAVLPARAPDALEAPGQMQQTPSGARRDEVWSPVDHGPPTLGRFGLSEAEKGDHTIYVDQEERRSRLHRKPDVTL